MKFNIPGHHMQFSMKAVKSMLKTTFYYFATKKGQLSVKKENKYKKNNSEATELLNKITTRPITTKAQTSLFNGLKKKGKLLPSISFSC